MSSGGTYVTPLYDYVPQRAKTNSGSTTVSADGVFFGVFQPLILTACTFKNNPSDSTSGGSVYITGGTAIIDNSLVDKVAIHANAIVYLKRTSTVSHSIYSITNNVAQARIVINSGATVVIKDSTVSGGTVLNNAAISVGTVANDGTITVTGTATIVYSGGTKKVSGTGTYIKKTGETNLTTV
jgi:hypothetical protein